MRHVELDEGDSSNARFPAEGESGWFVELFHVLHEIAVCFGRCFLHPPLKQLDAVEEQTQTVVEECDGVLDEGHLLSTFEEQLFTDCLGNSRRKEGFVHEQ